MKRREQIGGGARKRPVSNPVDPIIGLIETHRKANAALEAECKTKTRDRAGRLQGAADRAAWALIDNPPTSQAGVNALLAYVVESTASRADLFPDADGSAARKGRGFIDELPKALLAAFPATDAIYSAIERHRKVYAALDAEISRRDMPGGGGFPNAAHNRELAAAYALIDKPPTTLAGWATLLRYAENRPAGDWPDCRNNASERDWFGELHLTLAAYLVRVAGVR